MMEKLRMALEQADAVLIGAGAGLSASAGFEYSGERFETYFRDFREKYGFQDMYSGGFHPYETLEEYWGFWSRYIYINRYMDAPKPVYENLRQLVRDKDYFVLTTNVDHCFQKAGFDKHRLFYTQGDYGLIQCSGPCHQKTYDNAAMVCEMVKAQGFLIGDNGELRLPKNGLVRMTVPQDLIPHCPVCGKPMSMNLRADQTFVEDAGWHTAADRYADFLRRHRGQRLLLLELGVGYNTPGIVKYSFWKMAYDGKNVTYACLNNGEACAPDAIRKKSICINGDIGEILSQL